VEVIIQDEEVDILLNDLIQNYGYDFTAYSPASLKRRINRLFILDRFPSFAEYRYRLKSDPEYMKRFVEQITVTVTEMFREPAFYKTLRQEVLPSLGTYPFIRIWHAGCSTGEEVYSMAILLKEAGLFHKSLLYATDINPEALQKAEAGVYAVDRMQEFTRNYQAAGGTASLSDYYTAAYNRAVFDKSLRRNVVFSDHSLVTDSVFAEVQFISCRNVMIYFNQNLQNRVITLFRESLCPRGFLGLGAKETLRFSKHVDAFRLVDRKMRIYQKQEES